MLVLTFLLVKWTDELDFIFGFFFMFEAELLKITGLTLLALALMRVMVVILNRINPLHKRRKKLILSILLTIFVSSYLYIDYASKLNSRLNDKTRTSLIQKIKPESEIYGVGYGTQAENLTLEEYMLLIEIAKFPKVPEMADKISYLYWHEDILPDHIFRLTYEVPVMVEVEEIEYKEKEFSKIQKVQSMGEKKLVIYETSSW